MCVYEGRGKGACALAEAGLVGVWRISGDGCRWDLAAVGGVPRVCFTERAIDRASLRPPKAGLAAARVLLDAEIAAGLPARAAADSVRAGTGHRWRSPVRELGEHLVKAIATPHRYE